MHDDKLLQMRRDMERAEAGRLAPGACASSQAVRRQPDPSAQQGHRLAFALDGDRIMHSLAFTRYIDKTQVFSLVDDDRITHRVLHVQLVSKISRSVGRLLGLNEDLIEAIALGHDIGHPPFGHDGERFLSVKCQEHGLGPFMHNLQSVHFLERVERGGQGLNLSLQVLDGILCHDGEIHTGHLAPTAGKDFAALDAEIAAKQEDPQTHLIPLTMEGCVVRICDTVAYIGRDLEDAITLDLIQRGDLPQEVVSVLGSTNGTMVYRLVEDLVAGSCGQGYVGFSEPVSQALATLKDFNLERIYLNPVIKTQHHKIEEGYHRLFEHFLSQLKAGNPDSLIYTQFLNDMSHPYQEQQQPAAKVRDFIAAMTDDYFLKCYYQLIWPGRLPTRFGR